MKIAWLVGAAVLAFGGLCNPPEQGKISVSPTAAPTVIAWRDLPATNVVPSPPPAKIVPPIPISAGAKACTAGQLEARLFSQIAAAGHTDSPVDFRNRSEVPCYLEGFPDITIFDASDNVVARAAGTDHRSTFFGDPPAVPILLLTGTPALVSPSGLIVDPPPQGQTEVHIEWYDCRAPLPARMAIELPNGGGRLTIQYAVTAPVSPTCDSSASSAPVSFLARGPFTPTGIIWPPPPVSLQFEATISAPATAKRGSIVKYLVRLKNKSPLNYVLDPCPDYVVFLEGASPVARCQLNCAPVGHIAPAGSVTFEMQLRVPLYMVSGQYELRWGLFDGRISGAGAASSIEIT